MRKYDMTVRVVGDLAASILAACRMSFGHCRRGTTTMHWIGETIDAPIAGALDSDVEQITLPFGRDLLHALHAMQQGDFSVRIGGGQVGRQQAGQQAGQNAASPEDGLAGQIAEAVNLVAEANQRIVQQLGRAVAAVTRGDLTQTVSLDVDGRPLKGDFLQVATLVNTMVQQLRAFATDMTRVASEIAADGMAGGPPAAEVPPALEAERAAAGRRSPAGLWKDVTENMNAAARRVSVEIAERADELARRLQDSEDGRTLALAAGKMGSWDWDLGTGRCVWDAGQRQIFGVDATCEVALPRIRALVHCVDWKMLCRQINRARRSGGASQLEFRVRRLDGSVRWCLGTAVASKDAGGRVTRLRGLTVDITERKETEDRQTLLARELDHRTKNALAVVHAIVSLTRADDIDQFSAAVEGRIQALARAHSLLSDSCWRGAKITDLIQGELAPFRPADPARIRLSGRGLALHPSAVQALALTVHELAANAASHGALSVAAGSVVIAWEHYGDDLVVQWRECGGRGFVQKGFVQEGLGMRIIRATVETQLCGNVAFDWQPDGLVCVLRVPCHPKSAMFGDFLFSIQNPAAWRRLSAAS
jgi:two-component sensor histidine kinase